MTKKNQPVTHRHAPMNAEAELCQGVRVHRVSRGGLIRVRFCLIQNGNGRIGPSAGGRPKIFGVPVVPNHSSHIDPHTGPMNSV